MAHIQVLFQGLSPQAEVWSWGMRFSDIPHTPSEERVGAWPADVTPADLQLMANNVASLNGGNCLPNDLRNRIPANARVTTVRVNQIASNGTLTSAAESPVTNGQGTSSLSFPLQTAAVITLNIGAQYGRSGRGRTFLPYWVAGSGWALDADGMFTLSTVTNLLTAYASHASQVALTISDFGDWTAGPTLVVFSPTRGRVRSVENLSMDRRPDQQRRRADRATGQDLRTRIAYPA